MKSGRVSNKIVFLMNWWTISFCDNDCFLLLEPLGYLLWVARCSMSFIWHAIFLFSYLMKLTFSSVGYSTQARRDCNQEFEFWTSEYHSGFSPQYKSCKVLSRFDIVMPSHLLPPSLSWVVFLLVFLAPRFLFCCFLPFLILGFDSNYALGLQANGFKLPLSSAAAKCLLFCTRTWASSTDHVCVNYG